MESIYSNPILYDSMFWWKSNDFEFWKTFTLHQNTKILELASGTGRLSIPLIKSGAIYNGLDASKNFCFFHKEKLKANNLIGKVYQKNMQNFYINEKFDVIFIAFNSFLHNYTDKEAIQCLKSVKKHLNPNGKFILDILMPNPLSLYRPKNVRLEVMEFIDPESSDLIKIKETVNYNVETEIIDINWYFINEIKNLEKTYSFSMRMFFPSKINDLLQKSKFKIKNIWGDYNKSKFTEDSEKQIYECII